MTTAGLQRVEADGEAAGLEGSPHAQSLLLAVARMLKTGLGFVVPVVLVRLLEQETFGHYRQIMLLSVTAGMALQFGLPASLFYFVPTAPRESQAFQVQTALLLGAIGLSAGVCVGLLASWPGFFGGALAPYALWVGLLVAFAAPALLAETAPVVDGRARLTLGVVAALDSLRGLLVIGVGLATRSLEAVLACIGLVLMGRVAFLAWYLGTRPHAAAVDSLRQRLGRQLTYALPLFAGSLFGIMREQLHSFFVAWQAPAEQFAVYAVATLEVPIVGHLIASVAEVLILRNAKAFGQGRLHDVLEGWHRGVLSLAVALLPIVAVLEFHAGDLIRLLFGDAYQGAAGIFRVFLITVPLSMLLSSSLLRAMAELRILILANVASFAVTVVVLAGVHHTGSVEAAVWSVVAGKLVFHGIAAWYIAGRFDLAPGGFLPWRALARLAALAVTAALLGAWATASLPFWLRPFAGGALALSAYAAVAWRAGLVPDAERDFALRLLDSAWARIRAGIRRRR